MDAKESKAFVGRVNAKLQSLLADAESMREARRDGPEIAAWSVAQLALQAAAIEIVWMEMGYHVDSDDPDNLRMLVGQHARGLREEER